jgi:hypothetical protein
MSNQTQTTKAGDASGRGSVAGYRVNFPARMRTYTEAEINAVANVMRNAVNSKRTSKPTPARTMPSQSIIARTPCA